MSSESLYRITSSSDGGDITLHVYKHVCMDIIGQEMETCDLIILLLHVHVVSRHGQCTYSHTHSLIHPLTHPLTHPPTHPFTHPSTHPPTHSPTHSPIHSFTHSITHPPTHPPTHPLTHSLTHQLTHSSLRPVKS